MCFRLSLPYVPFENIIPKFELFSEKNRVNKYYINVVLIRAFLLRFDINTVCSTTLGQNLVLKPFIELTISGRKNANSWKTVTTPIARIFDPRLSILAFF